MCKFTRLIWQNFKTAENAFTLNHEECTFTIMKNDASNPVTDETSHSRSRSSLLITQPSPLWVGMTHLSNTAVAHLHRSAAHQSSQISYISNSWVLSTCICQHGHNMKSNTNAEPVFYEPLWAQLTPYCTLLWLSPQRMVPRYRWTGH